jgi:DinB superfamily
MTKDVLAPGALAVLASTPAVFGALFRGQPEEALDRAGEEGWSAKDVLAHLISMQPPALVGRVSAMVENELPLLPDADEHEYLEASGLRGRPAKELLQTFAASRAEAVRFFERLSAEDYQRRGRHAVAGEISVADAIHHMSYHDLLHVAQAANLLAEPMERGRGAMRRAFPV